MDDPTHWEPVVYEIVFPKTGTKRDPNCRICSGKGHPREPTPDLCELHFARVDAHSRRHWKG